MEAVVFHQPDGVVLWPLEEVALLREEWDGRLEATFKDGVLTLTLPKAESVKPRSIPITD